MVRVLQITVILKHLFHPDEFLEEPGMLKDLEGDIKEECAKLGQVEKVAIFFCSPTQNFSHFFCCIRTQSTWVCGGVSGYQLIAGRLCLPGGLFLRGQSSQAAYFRDWRHGKHCLTKSCCVIIKIAALLLTSIPAFNY